MCKKENICSFKLGVDESVYEIKDNLESILFKYIKSQLMLMKN